MSEKVESKDWIVDTEVLLLAASFMERTGKASVSGDTAGAVQILRDASGTITALRAQVEKLRGALEKIEKEGSQPMPESRYTRYDLAAIARLALADEPDSLSPPTVR